MRTTPAPAFCVGAGLPLETSMARPTKKVQFLRACMERNKLSRADVSRALHVSVSTVDRWLVPSNKTSHRDMPDMAFHFLALLENTDHFAPEESR